MRVTTNREVTKTFNAKINKDSENRIIVDMTVQQKDRDNEVLLVSGADLSRYQENPIIQADHSFSIEKTVGSFKWIKKHPANSPNRIRGLPRFADTDFAQDVFTLVAGDHVKGVSHTFIAKEYTDDQGDIDQLGAEYDFDSEGVGKVYTQWEPLEVSFVTVPANTEALVQLADEGKLKSKAYLNIAKELQEKPYKNFHSCDISDKDYDKYRTEKCGQKHDGKCIDVRYGIVSDNGSEISSLLYSIDEWSKSAARKHCDSRDGTFHAATGEEAISMRKGAIPYKEFPTADKDRNWDAGEAVQRLQKWAGGPDKEDIDWSKYRTAFCWYDSDESENYTSYKFPIVDVIGGTAKVVWRAVANARARLPQSNITEKEKVKNRLKKYYKDFDEDWERSFYTDENIKDIDVKDIEVKLLKLLDEAKSLTESIIETGQDSQPGSGDQSGDDESEDYSKLLETIENL